MSRSHDNHDRRGLTRRGFLANTGRATAAVLLGRFVTGCATTGVLAPPRRTLSVVDGRTIDLQIAETRLAVAGQSAVATTVNGGIPGPEIRLREGQDVTLRVSNALDEDTSIHWHGLLVPPGMDGVPGPARRDDDRRRSRRGARVSLRDRRGGRGPSPLRRSRPLTRRP